VRNSPAAGNANLGEGRRIGCIAGPILVLIASATFGELDRFLLLFQQLAIRRLAPA
jgi:hypothetical protein